jgi:AcrR family transcriptional regulator
LRAITYKVKRFISQIKIQVNEKTFLKDPYSSELGKRIIEKGIELIDKIGLEAFTFKKLATILNTNESSIYRYFESKQKLLVYLISWYWSWLEYHLIFSTANITDPKEKLQIAIRLITKDASKKESHDFIKLDLLSKIVVSESSKAYLTKEVDASNRIGFYSSYKSFVERISEIVLELNPKFKHPHTLVSTIVEGVHHQKFFSNHLPSLTDVKKNDADELANFYTNMATATILNFEK